VLHHSSACRTAGRRVGHVRPVGVDDAVVLNISPIEVEEEGSLLAQRAAYVAVPLQRMVRRLILRERIGGVKSRRAGIHKQLTMQFVCAGLGQYLDTPIAGSVILGGEGVLVDDDGTDRRLGRQLPSGQPLNKN